MKLTMETAAALAGFSRDPDARVFVCDQCKHQYKTFDDPDLHEGKACPHCAGGAYEEHLG